MKNGYIIGGSKLSEKQFSDKYWLNGDAKYQFHSMDIEDGLDERQQLLINNDRALLDLLNWHRNFTMERERDIEAQINSHVKMSKRTIAALVAVNAAITAMLITIIHFIKRRVKR